MFVTIDSSDPRPLYRQIADGIKDLIARGELSEGMALPGLRQLSGDLGVNLNTIATAYRELQDEGLVKIRHGSGAVVSSTRSHDVQVDELRKPLRAALTRFVLAGATHAEILSVVQRELDSLDSKGVTR